MGSGPGVADGKCWGVCASLLMVESTHAAVASMRATTRAVIPRTRNSFFTFAPTGLRVADKGAEAGHDEAADSDLDQRAVKRDLEKAPAYPGDGDQLHRDHDVGDLQCGLGVADQERESVKSPSYKGRDPGQSAADQRIPAPAQLSVVGKRLREAQADGCPQRSRQTDEEGGMRAYEEGGGEDRRQRGDGAVDQADERWLDEAQDLAALTLPPPSR